MTRIGFALAALVPLFAGCADSTPSTRAVYLLLDTSGTYRNEVTKAQTIANYLLGTLVSGDSLALARIDSGSFTEKDVVARVTFDDRPSHANQQKRAFKSQLDRFVTSAASSAHTDITGAVLQATEWLNETGARSKYILVFSDLEEDVQKGFVRDFPIDVTGVQIVALNVTKLGTDQVDPREYMERLANWEKRVVSGGGTFRVINDLERLDGLLGS
ncbi:MAG: VWA domain-containing protein [Gammaproteobacteria bacterium]